MRARKPKDVEGKLLRYAANIVNDPQSLRGQWNGLIPGCHKVWLDLGCGKGTFTVSTAQRNPEVLFVGVDNENICIASAARKAVEQDVTNVQFVLSDADSIDDLFAPGELETIFLNFSTPCPKAKQADKRLTHAQRLLAYRELLSADGTVQMKTDSQPLFDWSLTQFELAGYDVEWMTRDLHADDPGAVSSDFETRLSALGAKICALRARPVREPQLPLVQTAPQGLVDYLPDDLESMDYVPYGMEDTVRNMINRRRKAASKQARQATRG